MTTAVVVILLVVLLIAAFRLWLTANRLDRLHVRTEAAWAALEGALSRRIVATRAAAAAGAFSGPDGDRLRQLSRQADRADRAHRADAENDLSRALAGQPPVMEADLAAELLDAGERVALARSFYNDAGRETRALRAAWFTRLFRLAGRAALPEYFEIADQIGAGTSPRIAARLGLFDQKHRVLLFSGGGGIEPTEELRGAAIRELFEETGLRLPPTALIGPIWRRSARFAFTGVNYEQTEFYFVAGAPSGFQVDVSGFSQVERGSITGHRWFSVEDLTNSADTVYPVELAQRLGEARKVLIAGQVGAGILDIN